MKRSYENLAAWRKAGQTLAGTLLTTSLVWSAAAVGPGNGGPVTQATPESPPPSTLSLSSPAGSDIIKMVEAKVDPAVIKAYIQSSTVAYNLGASELIAMKNHGVSDEIVTAMLEHTTQLRSQMAQAAHASQQASSAAPAYAEPAPPPPYATTAAYEPNPSDYGTYAPYADYGYSYPYYPYSYWYSYGYPWYYYGYPYCGYYGHYGRYCGYYGHYGSYYHNGHWYHQHPGSPGHPHSTGTFAHSTGVGRNGSALTPVSGFHSRPTSFAMNRSGAMGTAGGVRMASIGLRGGGGGFHAVGGGGVRGGGGSGGHAGGGGGHAGGGRR